MWCTTPGSVSSCSTGVGDTGRVIGGSGNVAFSVWFKTSTAGGVLLSEDPELPGQNCTLICGAIAPLLSIGSNGHLDSHVCLDGDCNGPMSSSAAVDNGAWHQAVVIPGTALYLDGKEVATDTEGFADDSSTYALLGAGLVSTTCVLDCESPVAWSYFDGSTADFSVYQDEVPSAGTVAAQYAAETTPAAELSSITSPDGRAEFAATYDTVNDRVATVTDANGGTWTYSDPANEASSGAYV
jgi:hypothetical protein